MEANLFVLNPVSLVYEFEQTGVEKALRLETQRQNVMTNLVQWISQKKRQNCYCASGERVVG